MCACKNIDFGTYANTVKLTISWGGGELVDIDKCLQEEILSLWALGIQTIESCCGHNKKLGYIAVKPQSVFLMQNLGYEQDFRTLSPGVFYPKYVKVK